MLSLKNMINNLTVSDHKGGDVKRAANIPEVKIGVNELYNNYDFGLFLRMIPFMDFGLIKET